MIIPVNKNQYLGEEVAILINKELEYAKMNWNMEVLDEMTDWSIAYAISEGASRKTDDYFIQSLIFEYCGKLHTNEIAEYIKSLK